MLRTLLLFVVAVSGIKSSDAAVVRFVYTAEISTITGNIFGESIPLLTSVNGFFEYDTAVADANASLERGLYRQSASSFLADVDGFNLAITGSNSAELQVENFDAIPSETFRFVDGDALGTMSLNGVANPQIELFFAISGPTTFFTDDSLPDPFPYAQQAPNFSTHTFSLTDGSATMLLQLTSITAVPEPSTYGALAFVGLGLAWRKRKRFVRDEG